MTTTPETSWTHRRAAPRRPLALALSALALLGCPGPDEPQGPCASEGTPALTLAARRGGPALADGGEVDVFPPPQGGVFTELDVTIEGLAIDDVDELRIDVTARDTGDVLASASFLGGFIQLMCTEDGVLALEAAPVGFSSAQDVAELDGVLATITGTVLSMRGNAVVPYDVTLRASGY